jgi:uncharacterized protein (TIGR02996 family)
MIEERAFLHAIMEQPSDDSRNLVYADWLDEQGDPRSEYLRLMIKVRQERVNLPDLRLRQEDLSAQLAELQSQLADAWRERRSTPETQECQRRLQKLERQSADLSKEIREQIPPRLQELAASFDPTWLAIVSDPVIEGCGKNGSDWRLRFDLLCDKSWADLSPTGDQNVRHCETCQKNVHFCDNLADAREHSIAGRCIAVDLGIPRRNRDLVPPTMYLGQPSRETLRESYEEDIDPVSEARLDARKEKGGKKGRQKRSR